MSVLNTMPWQSSGTDDGWTDWPDVSGAERFSTLRYVMGDESYKGGLRILTVYGELTEPGESSFKLVLPEESVIGNSSAWLKYTYSSNGVLSQTDTDGFNGENSVSIYQGNRPGVLSGSLIVRKG